MKIRIKKSRIVLLTLAVLLVGLPPVFGMLTESAVRNQVETLRNEGRLLVTVEEYDRGWFSSRALLSIAPSPDGDPDRQALIGFVEPMTVVVDFEHGPLSVQSGIFFGFSELHARPALSADGTLLDAPFDFEFHAQSNFGGTLNFAGEVRPFDSAGPGFALSSSGGRFHGTVAGARTQVEVDAETLQLTQGDVTYSLLGVRGAADTERFSRYVMPGVMTLEIDRMAMDREAAEQRTVFDVRALAAEYSTALDDARSRLEGAVKVGLERLRLGSDTEVTNARVETAAERIDVAALAAYLSAAERAAENGLPFADEVEPALMRLLAEGPAITLDTLRFDMNGEALEANAEATVDPASLSGASATDLGDPTLWMRVLDGRAELVVAKTLAEEIAVSIAKAQIGGGVAGDDSMPGQSVDALARAQAGLAIAVLAAQGVLEDTGDAYRTELRLEKGSVAVNGQRLPFFGLQ